MDDPIQGQMAAFAEHACPPVDLPREEALAAVHAPDADTRQLAVRRLMRLRGQDVVRALLLALEDPVISVRSLAVLALGSQGGPEDAEAEKAETLLRVFREDGSASVRMICAGQLGYLEDTRVLPALVAGLQDRDGRVIRSVCAALHGMKAVGAVDALMAVLEHPSPLCRKAACETLIALGVKDARIISTLERLRDDPQIRELEEFSRTYGPALQAAIAASIQEDDDCESDSASADAEEPDPSSEPSTVQELLELARQPAPTQG